MAKEKKKSLGIKTTRYFTKTCGQCKFEYPNWFTSCPKCGATWDSTIEKLTDHKEISKKSIKIVVKITEDDFNESINSVQLIFSANQGKSWYQMEMENKQDYFLAEISDVPTMITIIYYIQVYLNNGEKVIENNDSQYFHYKVGAPIEESKENGLYTQPEDIDKAKEYAYKEEESTSMTDTPNDKVILFQPKETGPPLEAANTSHIFINKPQIHPPENPTQYNAVENLTIFGKPQTQVDPDLKVCPYCNSKIKKMWSTCPICGRDI